MKKLLILFFLLFASVAEAQIAQRASSSATATGDPLATMNTTPYILSLGATAQPGDVVIVSVGYSRSSAVITLVEDNNGTDYTSAATPLVNASAFMVVETWYLPVVAGTSTDVRITGSSNSGGGSFVYVAAWTGVASSSIVGNVANDNTTVAATQATSSGLSSSSGDLLIAAINGDSNRTWDASSFSGGAATAGFRYNAAFTSVGLDYRVTSGVETIDHSITFSGNLAGAHQVIAFHPAATGSVVNQAPLLRLVGERQ